MVRNKILLLPIAGIVVFTVLYMIAAALYPGGSQQDPLAVGFSIKHNYWCNLVNEHSIDGNVNPGQPFALAGMIALALSLSTFWYVLPGLMSTGIIPAKLVKTAGILAMIPALLIGSPQHDTMMYFSALFGVLALSGTVIALYKAQWNKLFWVGILIVVTIVLNNILYHSADLIRYLPVVQKLSFGLFLSWICVISIKLYQVRPALKLPEKAVKYQQPPGIAVK